MTAPKSLFSRQTSAVGRVLMEDIEPPEITARNNTKKSVSTLGVMSAILLQKLTGQSHAYRIIDGKRRYAAAKAAGFGAITAIVLDEDATPANIAALQASLNINRSSNILDEALAIRAMMDALTAEHVTEPDAVKLISEEVGISTTTVKQRLRIAGLRPELLTAIKEKRLAAGVAGRIARMSEEDQATLAAQAATGDIINSVDVSKLRDTRNRATIARLPFEVTQTETVTGVTTWRDMLAAAAKNMLATGHEFDELTTVLREVAATLHEDTDHE